jgi:hypothetical protein
MLPAPYIEKGGREGEGRMEGGREGGRGRGCLLRSGKTKIVLRQHFVIKVDTHSAAAVDVGAFNLR